MTQYATPDELSSQTTIDLGKYGTQVTALLTACSEAINNACHRPDGFVADSAASARTYVGSGKNYQRIDECVAITLVETKNSITDSAYVSWSASDWIAFRGSPKRPNFNALSKDEPYPYTGVMVSLLSDTYSYFPLGLYTSVGQPNIRVTAKWGYAVTVPDAIKQATIIQATRFFKRGQAVWADALANSDFGEVRFVKKTDPAYDYLIQHGFIKPQIG